MKYTVDSLRRFELDVVDAFKNKEIRAPVHLYHGNEEKMIEIFENIRNQDWIFCTWRSHYQCLLKGVPEQKLMEKIKEGQSISLNFPEYKIFSSAIVGGNIPIATGVALSNKLRNIDEMVYCFVGDMTSETGCFHENYKYSINYDLPIIWVIENNGKSVCTDTLETWKQSELTFKNKTCEKIIYYEYETIYPHAGVGERIQF